MTSDTYRTITTRFRGIAPSGKAIFVDKPKNQPRRDWAIVPRSLIHGGDDLKIENKAFREGEEITIRVMEWKAEELGFA